MTTPDGQRTYFLKVPDGEDHGRFNGYLLRKNAQEWHRLALLDALKEAVTELLPAGEDAAERENLTGVIDAYAERLREANKRYLDERTEETLTALGEAWPMPPALEAVWRQVLAVPVETRFHRMEEQNGQFPFVAGMAAARLLVGWEGVTDREGNAVAFRKGLGGVPEDVVGAVPTPDLPLLAAKVQEMLRPPEIRLGNSPSPSSGSSNRTTSGETRTPRPNGRSTPKAPGTSDSSALTTPAQLN